MKLLLQLAYNGIDKTSRMNNMRKNLELLKFELILLLREILTI